MAVSWWRVVVAADAPVAVMARTAAAAASGAAALLMGAFTGFLLGRGFHFSTRVIAEIKAQSKSEPHFIGLR